MKGDEFVCPCDRPAQQQNRDSQETCYQILQAVHAKMDGRMDGRIVNNYRPIAIPAALPKVLQQVLLS